MFQGEAQTEGQFALGATRDANDNETTRVAKRFNVLIQIPKTRASAHTTLHSLAHRDMASVRVRLEAGHAPRSSHHFASSHPNPCPASTIVQHVLATDMIQDCRHALIIRRLSYNITESFTLGFRVVNNGVCTELLDILLDHQRPREGKGRLGE